MRQTKITRRQVLEVATGAVCASGLFLTPAFADDMKAKRSARAKQVIEEFLKGSVPKPGKVVIDVANLQENGFSVPITIRVESPMTADDFVSEIFLVCDGNPDPGVIRIGLTPLSGQAKLTTRIRMARSQNIIAIARMNDGSTFIDKKHVKVTVGGCGA